MKTAKPATFAALAERCAAEHLAVLGGFHPNASDGAPEGCETLVMIGPAPGFWAHFTGSDEYQDQAADALDRWSTRVLEGIASAVNAQALFPFGGPPFLPFISWALRSGQCFTSPVGLLVHADHGLMVSYRGALAFTGKLPLPPPEQSPCLRCDDKPCLTACPIGALGSSGYDIPACKAYMDGTDGKDCETSGCCVRRACPLDSAQRQPEQSGFHMRAFLGKQGE